MSEREQQILTLIRQDPMISQQAIAVQLGISRSAVAGYIMTLTDKGVLKGRGYVFNDEPFIAVIGGANIDIHGAPNTNLRMNDSNPGRVETSPGGVARNVAENLARLDVDTRLIAPIGNDQHGELILQQGRAAGIDMRHVMQLNSARTSTYLSVLDDSGDMHVGISDMSIIEQLGAEQLQKHEAMLKQAAIIIIDSNLETEALTYLSDTFSKQTLFVDTVSTTKAMKLKPHLNTIHTLKPALIEAETLAGITVKTDKQLPKLADWFHNAGVGRLFITLGKRGVFYSTSEEQGIEKTNVKHNVSNAGGAGDAFLAGLAYAWLKQWTLKRSIRFSLAAAGVTLAHSDTNSPNLSLASVNRLYKRHHV